MAQDPRFLGIMFQVCLESGTSFHQEVECCLQQKSGFILCFHVMASSIWADLYGRESIFSNSSPLFVPRPSEQ